MNKILQLLRFENMTKDTIKADFISGLTVAMLLIPQSMAYAGLAGLPAYYGLYAAFIPVILSGIFGHLHQLGTGPVAMTSIITASVASAFALQGSQDYISVILLLSLLVGIIRLLMGIFKMASVVNLISHPVISGFTSAGAIIIGLSQLPKIFGISVNGQDGFLGNLRNLYQLVIHLDQTHLVTLYIGVGAIIVILVTSKFFPKVPYVLVAVVLSIVVSKIIGFESNFSGAVIGEVPKGLPKFNLIVNAYNFTELIDLVIKLLPGAFVITLISFMEVLSVSKAVSAQTKQTLDLNRELIGQGIAAIGGGFFNSYPVSGSFSRTALNLISGGKTGLSSVFTGIIVMILLLFFTPLLYHLPTAVLAVSIIIAVKKLINFTPMIRSFKANKQHGIISFITFFGTLAFAPNMHFGVLLGITLTIIAYLTENMKPRAVVAGKYGDGTLRDAEFYDIDISKEVILLRIDSSINFLNSGYFQEFLMKASSSYPDIKCMIIIAEGINRIDSSGEWMLRQVASDLREKEIRVMFAGLKRAALEPIKNTGLYQEIGKMNFYRSVEQAMEVASHMIL